MASKYAARKPRTRLVRPWTLAGFVVLVAAGLGALFVRTEIGDFAAQGREGDALTEVYLSALHAFNRADSQGALLLAKNRLAQGRADEALALVKPHLASADGAVRGEASRLELDALRAAGKGERLAAAVRVRLQHASERDDWLEIARYAEASGDRELVRTIYRRLAAEARDAQWLEATAARFLGWRDYRFAAELLFLARRRAGEPDRSRELYLAAVRALRSGDLAAEALEAAEKELGSLGEDETVLLELVHVARAAGRPDRAAHFMSRVIWLRQKPAAPARRLNPLAWLIRAAWAAPDGPARMRSFDPQVYALAYEVFLQNSELESAYRVAREAVAHRPQDREWRVRLARVCEQSGRPAEALAAWRWLAERTDAQEAWQAVLRLAPGLHDEEALAAALRRQATRKGATAADLRALAGAYERLGRAEEGMAWFEDRYRATGSITALEIATELAAELGRSEKALALGRELVRNAPSAERVLRLASLQVMAGRFAEAHALLWRHRGRADAQARRYWKLMADLAWMLQEDASAIEALRIVARYDDSATSDFERLVALLRPREPEEAARVAEAGFARLRDPGLLLVALEIRSEKRDLPELKRMYGALKPSDEVLFRDNAYFYRLRSHSRRMLGELAGARADMQRAQQIAPDDPEQRLALLWMLIELRERESLRRALAVETARAANERAFWPPLAAGWMTLEEPKRARPFLARLVEASPRDFLWLATYAEALEQDGELNAADRVRRHALAVARAGSDKPDRERLEQLARIALRQTPGDPALHALRRLERKSPGDELVLSWLVSSEQHEQARRWLSMRHARGLSSPVWIEAALALAEHDAAAAARLLEARSAELSGAQGAELARLVGRRELALALAFDAHSARPADDALHQQLEQAMLDHGSRAGVDIILERLGAMEAHRREAEAQLAVTPRLRLGIQLRTASQQSNDEGELRNVPSEDRAGRAAIRVLIERGWAEAAVGAREGFADSVSARLRHFRSWSRRFSTLFTAARNERTSDSPALAVAGMRDELSLLGSYELSKTEYLAASGFTGVYRSQNGIRLGTARGYELEAGHRVRIDYPDLTVRLFAAGLRTRTEGEGDPASAVLNPAGSAAPGFFVPESSTRYGAGVSLGESVREGWTRALRPYAGLDLIHSSVSGGGYHARLGLRASVLGPDRLWIFWSHGRSVGASNDTAREFGIRYEYRFSGI